MTARASYQDHLAAGTTAEPLPCDHCGKITPAWGLYRGTGQEPTGWICGGCISSTARDVAAALADASKPPESSWDSDLGVYLKATRNGLLDLWRWTIFPDSPLSVASQAAFLAYLGTLNRMTVDCADPRDWEWPSVPAQEY